MSKRPLNPDEKRAWARVAKTIQPRKDQPIPEMPPIDGLVPLQNFDDTAPAKVQRPLVAFHPFATPPPREKPATAPVQNRSKERRVRRGQAPVSAMLDLHGYTQATAQSALISFLSHQRRAGATCVLVITGKGKLGEGVLRRGLLAWLKTTEARALVNGYSQAHRKHGGSGAWYIFLRKLATK